MIERLLLKNFQCHDRLVIDFSPHVTTIVGRTSAGKSAVLRALRWVTLNDLRGSSFIGDWGQAKYALAKLTIDGQTVARKRGEEINTYIFNDKVLKAPGKKVPEPIADLVNLAPVNFQNQIEPPYWFTLPPGQVSKNLNDIINLGSIDRALANATAGVRKAKSFVVVSKERLESFKKERNDTAWAVEFSVATDRADLILSQIAQIDARASGLAAVASAVKSAGLTRQNADKTLSGADKTLLRVQRFRRLAARLDSVRSLVCQLARSRALAGLPDLNPDRAKRLRIKLSELERRHTEFSGLWFSISQMQWEVKDAKRRIRRCRKKIGALKIERCKTCGQVLRPLPSDSGTVTSHTTHRLQERRLVRNGIARKSKSSNK